MNAEIKYGVEPQLKASEFIDVLKRSTLDERRPVDDLHRIEQMLEHADLVVTARDPESLLVGVSRAISDFSYSTYLSDLAVDVRFQGQGIGKQLMEFTHEQAGRATTLILLAAPKAASYYPHVGLSPHDSCWIRQGT